MKKSQVIGTLGLIALGATSIKTYDFLSSNYNLNISRKQINQIIQEPQEPLNYSLPNLSGTESEKQNLYGSLLFRNPLVTGIYAAKFYDNSAPIGLISLAKYNNGEIGAIAREFVKKYYPGSASEISSISSNIQIDPNKIRQLELLTNSNPYLFNIPNLETLWINLHLSLTQNLTGLQNNDPNGYTSKLSSLEKVIEPTEISLPTKLERLYASGYLPRYNKIKTEVAQASGPQTQSYTSPNQKSPQTYNYDPETTKLGRGESVGQVIPIHGSSGLEVIVKDKITGELLENATVTTTFFAQPGSQFEIPSHQKTNNEGRSFNRISSDNWEDHGDYHSIIEITISGHNIKETTYQLTGFQMKQAGRNDIINGLLVTEVNSAFYEGIELAIPYLTLEARVEKVDYDINH